MSDFLLRAEQLGKAYTSGKEDRWIFRQLDFSIKASESLSLMGPSGSGKSTLLNVLGLLTEPSEGEFFFEDKNLKDCSFKQKELYRSQSIGFVFQKHLLLPELSLLENICLPLAKSEGWSPNVLAQGKTWLEQFELNHRAKARPSELSGGEAQRGAIIRALIHRPKLLLLDEPTGNLDPKISQQIIEKLLEYAQQSSCSVVFVTHDYELAKKTDRHGFLKENGIVWGD